MSDEYEFSNVTLESFLDQIESMILQNPDMDGVEIDDSRGRTWFITLTSEHSKMN